jgi:hypothetical protein
MLRRRVRQLEPGRLLHREILAASEDFVDVASRRSRWPSARGFDSHIATLDVAGFGEDCLNTASRCGSARPDEIADHGIVGCCARPRPPAQPLRRPV